MDLFKTSSTHYCSDIPLALRMRPSVLSEFTGQKHIIGEGKLLRRAIEADRLHSLLVFGPPGVGKTSLATCIAGTTKAKFVSINAVNSNVEELRKIILEAEARRQSSGQKTVLFIDEIHRFNKSQQDVLMPFIEEGNPILIGATIHNPCYAIIPPLVSRSLVFELKPLEEKEIVFILESAIGNKEKGLGNYKIKADPLALKFIATRCDGDARKALNALEVGILTTPASSDGFICFDLSVAGESMQKKITVFDKGDDAHYDTASAFIKSMRGSDPDAAVYWLARMLQAGEDPRFIARRICICASEDVGNADPLALVLAHAAMQIAEFIGLPEAQIPLAQAAIYIASAPKSNASYMAIKKAVDAVEDERTQAVPVHLKNTVYKNASGQNNTGYKYPHDYEGNHIKQEYMEQAKSFYHPTQNGYEAKIKARLERFQQISSYQREKHGNEET